MAAPNAGFVWSIADMLRGPFKPKEYGKVILPFTVLARLDAVLEPVRLASIRCDNHPEALAVRYVRATGQHLCAECAAEQTTRKAA